MTSTISVRALFVLVTIHSWFALPTRGSADPRVAELRAQYFAPSYRWTPRARDRDPYDSESRSLYFSPGVGGRYFPRNNGHGALVDLEYRLDSQVDDWCLFDPCEFYDVDFASMHVGYAYRAVVLSPRKPKKRFWAFTPHVSFATGWSKGSGDVSLFSGRAAFVGARVGFDIDFHFRRFFFGWSLRYEGDYDTSGSAGWSHFFSWNALPTFRFGVDLGRKQAKYDDVQGM